MNAAALQPAHTRQGVAGARGYRVGVLTTTGSDEFVIEAFPGRDALLRVLEAAESIPGVVRVDTVSAVDDRR